MLRPPEQTKAEAVSAARPQARTGQICRRDRDGAAVVTPECDIRAESVRMSLGSRRASVGRACRLRANNIDSTTRHEEDTW